MCCENVKKLYLGKLKILLLLCFLIIVVPVMFSGCQQSQVRGVRERNKLEAEPEITVKFPDGTEERLEFEEYITGVVAGEMKPDWPDNAYAAQAIIARTFALKYLSENNTDVISGSYEYAQEYKAENITESVREAVARTRGEVVVYKDDYINAWFHASAGGQTTSAEVGLAYEKEEPPYIKSVQSPDEKAPVDVQEWTVVFSIEEIQSALSEMGKDFGDLNNIIIDNKDNTGRVIDFVFEGSNGKEKVKAANFRNVLDPKKLKSTMIKNLSKENEGYKFSGSGYGHGVGMSQWGAYSFAQEGKTPEEIIDFYFQGVEIVKEYE